ncbi:hypothetical protein Poli38472_009047 [Pythium oligandrum]|uniref:Multiple inositol polyphosphate phosphatase 1 n=1 Tax=Pythium oligandrum TaxID=41045 RepID=A0A8K1CLK4_PYTOL|nr:hypothetical protein Poli38472_009047 [Pythium oligandrum]|eukprot:TMW64880.1 hypothetical protein Poli38472_009047 [Pythium oligandrum]
MLVLCWTLLMAVAVATPSTSEVLTQHMSTKTMYPVPSLAELKEETEAEKQAAQENDALCRPVQLNYVIRHGTRFPTIKDIRRINATHERLTHASAPLAWTQHWTNPYDPDRAGWLADVGVSELIAMGKRLRLRFGDAFHQHFNSDKFVFEHTYKPRTKQSAMAFAYGFFQEQLQSVLYHTDPIGQDTALRFFDNCPALDLAVARNKSATIEHKRYRLSKQMHRNLRRFQRLAGQPLEQSDLEAAYAACAFDVSVRGRLDEWCTLFDQELLFSMDYFHDLKHFYKKSHGNALAFEVASPLLQAVHRTMLQRIRGENTVEGHFRFAHAETILPLASLLNLTYFDRHANDREGHFLADTPLDIATTRSFRGSKLSPFAANIGFVLYECHDTTGPVPPTYRVQTLFHERTVTFPECDHARLCPFERFERMFWQWIHEYDFFSVCGVSG